MLAYIVRRLLFIVPTLLGIMALNFIVIHVAPGGPIDQILSDIKGTGVDVTARVSGIDSGELQQGGGGSGDGTAGSYRGAQGLDPEFIKELEQQYGFDKPWYERFGTMIWNYARFDFGESYFRDQTVIDLIWRKCRSRSRSGFGPRCSPI